jgi:amino acid adenylation domain-containing protein
MAPNTIQGMLSEAFIRFCDLPAIEYNNTQISYRELDYRSEAIACKLAAKGIKKGAFIAVLLENKIELIATLIGILKAGCVFIPLDPLHPVKRMEVMLQSTDTRYLLIDKPNYQLLAHLFKEQGGEIEAIVKDESQTQESPMFSRPEVEYHPEDAIYIYFTSGSTGRPKAVLGMNKSLAHFINWEIETLKIDIPWRVSQFTSPSFDASLRDFFVPLCSGGTVCIPQSREQILNSASLINWIENSRINLIHCTPSLFRIFNLKSLSPEHFPNLKYVLLAGERIHPPELENWFVTFGERIQLVNLYGPTETTMVKTFYFIKKADTKTQSISIGKPMKGSRIIILDEHMNPCGEGTTGEIYIRTPYRTLGYYNDPELNHQKFLVNPFTGDPKDLIYRTEDLGRLLPDGNLEFLGRIDRQVKIRGNRIELAEVEAKLLKYEPVKEAVVLDRENTGGLKYLCAYVTADQEVKVDELRGFLKKELPDYMIPSFFIQLEKIPLTANGKADWRLLPEPSGANIISEEYLPPRNSLEQELVQVWQQVLGIDKIGINDNFFNLGGDSLKIVQVIARLASIQLEIKDLFLRPTIMELSEMIQNEPERFSGAKPEAASQLKPMEEQHLPEQECLEPDRITAKIENSKVLPMCYPPPVMAYPAHGNLLSVILDHEEAFSWFYNYYIQLEAPPEGEGIRLDFYTTLLYKTCPFIYYQRISRELIAKKWDKISDYIIDCLNLGYYVYFLIDRFYIPEYAEYQKEHKIHDIFVFGYDLSEKSFNVADCFSGGLYRYATATFTQIENGYKNIHLTGRPDWFDGVELISYRDKFHYTFDINLMIGFMKDYLSSTSTSQRYKIPSEKYCAEGLERKNFVYGLAVYQLLQEFMKKFRKDLNYDIRPFYVLWNHKTVMLDRIKYLAENNYLKKDGFLTEGYTKIAEETLNIRNLVLETMVTENPKYVDFIIEKLGEIAEQERKTLENLLESLTV